MTDDKNKSFEELAHFRNTLMCLGANVPICVLCLPSDIEKILLDAGCERVYDLFFRDLRDIKGIGDKRLGIITARLDESFSVGI